MRAQKHQQELEMHALGALQQRRGRQLLVVCGEACIMHLQSLAHALCNHRSEGEAGTLPLLLELEVRGWGQRMGWLQDDFSLSARRVRAMVTSRRDAICVPVRYNVRVEGREVGQEGT